MLAFVLRLVPTSGIAVAELHASLSRMSPAVHSPAARGNDSKFLYWLTQWGSVAGFQFYHIIEK